MNEKYREPKVAIEVVNRAIKWIQDSPKPSKRGYLCLFWDDNIPQSQLSYSVDQNDYEKMGEVMYYALKAFPILIDLSRKALEQLDKERADHE